MSWRTRSTFPLLTDKSPSPIQKSVISKPHTPVSCQCPGLPHGAGRLGGGGRPRTAEVANSITKRHSVLVYRILPTLDRYSRKAPPLREIHDICLLIDPNWRNWVSQEYGFKLMRILPQTASNWTTWRTAHWWDFCYVLQLYWLYWPSIFLYIQVSINPQTKPLYKLTRYYVVRNVHSLY